MITLQNLIPDFSKKLLLKAAAAASVLFLSVTLSAIPSFAASAYDNLAVANVTSEPLNMRTKPSTAGEIVGKCYRGAGGTVLERKDGWTKVRSGKIEGWMSDKYLLFGTDIEPLAKELGLLSAKITATTLNVREIPSTDSAILKQAAEGDSFPVLSVNPTAGQRSSSPPTQTAIFPVNTPLSARYLLPLLTQKKNPRH